MSYPAVVVGRAATWAEEEAMRGARVQAVRFLSAAALASIVAVAAGDAVARSPCGLPRIDTLVASNRGAGPGIGYCLEVLSVLPGDAFGYATAVNARGKVVGSSGEANAFSWEAGRTTRIPPLPGDQFIAVTDVAVNGAAVGNSVDERVGTNNPLIHEAGRTRPLPFANALPYAINDRGSVAGGAVGLGAFLYRDGEVIALPAGLAGYGLNERDQVVGVSERQTPFLYADGRFVDLPTQVRRPFGSAEDINDDGTVVGYVTATSILEAIAVRFGRDEVLSLGRLKPTDTYSVATAINACGQIVGFSGRNPDLFGVGGIRAFLWVRGRMIDLNDLVVGRAGFVLTAATGIGDRGQIVGRGSLGNALRPFLLTPRTPERSCRRA